MSLWHRGKAVSLPLDNIDTDQLIPARFMSTPRAEGYGRFLLHDLRGPESPPDFPLDQPGAKGASILIAGRNFGAGSSREAAAYALLDAGFKAVIAPSFGDIFAANAVQNGLLPARADTEALLALIGPEPREIALDLEAGLLRIGNHALPFDCDPVWRLKLLNGWDDLDLTSRHVAEIRSFAHNRRKAAPWLWTRTDLPPQ